MGLRAGLRAIPPDLRRNAPALLCCAFCLAGLRPALGQTVPIAIVPVEGVELTGGMNVAQGKAMISSSGSVTAGEHPATITLPHRGNLRICATTKVDLTADSSVDTSHSEPGNTDSREAPGLMMALGRGALEANFATGANSDVILTPDFRILISGPGTAQVQVRLGMKGDTCVDNRGANAPYVTVTSIFDGGAYRVQPQQRVMFQHGSLREVVDNEKESCGCPAEPVKTLLGNEFPLAQSEGLAPLSTPPPNAAPQGMQAAQATVQMGYDGTHSSAAAAEAAAATAPAVSAAAVKLPAAVEPLAAAPTDRPVKRGFFHHFAHFFKKLFGD
jgi:hypothetical protein